MFEIFINSGILVGFIGIFLSAFVGFLKINERGTSLAPLLLGFSGIIGFLSSILFFSSPSKEITLFSTDMFLNLNLVLDKFSAIFFAMVSGIAALTAFYSIGYLSEYKNLYHHKSLHFLTGLFVFGMLGVLLAQNIFGFMFFWEIMSVSSFFLVMADKSQKSVNAALLYFVMTHLGALAILGGFFLLGDGNIFIDFNTLHELSNNVSLNKLIFAFILFFFGFASKAGLIPFHIWLPEAHPQAPSHISALMSGVMLKIAIFVFLKILLIFPALPEWAYISIIILGGLSAVTGVLHSLLEKDIKRVFAYSSIENIGIIFLMIGAAFYFSSPEHLFNRNFLFFAIFYALNHAVFKSGLFLAAGIIVSKVHSRSLEMMGGLAKRLPIFSGLFLIFILSAASLPPFGSFYAEWGFLQSLFAVIKNPLFSVFERSFAIILLAILTLVAGLAIFSMVRVFGISMLGAPRSKEIFRMSNIKFTLIWPLLILSVCLALSGIFTELFLTKSPFFLNTKAAISSAATTISPLTVFLVFAFLLFLVFLIRRFISNKKNEREYHTWDCGQPIDSAMQYTATGFSAPIRFFFRFILGAKKEIASTPLIPGNPWIMKHFFYLPIKYFWYDKIFRPLGNIVIHCANYLKMIQNGRIQFYIFLLLLTLIISLILAL